MTFVIQDLVPPTEIEALALRAETLCGAFGERLNQAPDSEDMTVPTRDQVDQLAAESQA